MSLHSGRVTRVVALGGRTVFYCAQTVCPANLELCPPAARVEEVALGVGATDPALRDRSRIVQAHHELKEMARAS